MTLVVVNVSWFLAIAGILVGAAVLVVFRQPLLSLHAMLDLFVAASLLRLSVDMSWAAIAGTVMVIAVRKTIARTLVSNSAAARPAGVHAN